MCVNWSFTGFLFSHLPSRSLPLLTPKHLFLWWRIYNADPDPLCTRVLGWMARDDVRCSSALLPTGQQKNVCGRHRASRRGFLSGWRAAVVFGHRASWDLMWAHHVATRVSGSVWVTGGHAPPPELHRFPPPARAGGRAAQWSITKCSSLHFKK